MDQDQLEDQQATLNQLQRAKRTLQDVETKMKRYKNRNRQKSQPVVNKAPFPDLNKYFSYLTNQYQNDEENDEILLQKDPKNIKKPRETSFPEGSNNRRMDKQNNSMSINQKLEKEKNSSINKIQEYYIERNQILEEKIAELKAIRQKIVKDQKLLLRNNEELEAELQRSRTSKQLNRIGELQQKIVKMKEKIGIVEEDNNKIILRKKDLEKHIKQVLKTHKEALMQDVLLRPKSSSAGRCQYH